MEFMERSGGGRRRSSGSRSSLDGGGGLSRSYQKRLLDRFQLVNQHCDLSVMEPVTFNSVNKLWLGGSDVLDYVVCYATQGNPIARVPDHWHYVSFGLSNIHGGDASPLHGPSGLGFELTFRLKGRLEGIPPAWPVDLLQKLARYIHLTNSLIIPGDHITWNLPLHGNPEAACEINHMLVASDPALPKLETPTGGLSFHQIVGATLSEVELAQRWNAAALLQLFREQEDLGGSFLVTDISRTESLLRLYPHLEGEIAKGIQREGSDLQGVGGRVMWTHNAKFYCQEAHWWALTEFERRQYVAFEERGRSSRRGEEEEEEEVGQEGGEGKGQDMELISKLLQESRLTEGEEGGEELPKHIRDRLLHPGKVHLIMNPDTARVLPLALRGRVEHSRAFTINDTVFEDVVTFLPKGMKGSFSKEHSFSALGSWLHISLPEASVKHVSEDVEALFQSNGGMPEFPRFLAWPEANIALTILEIKD